VIASDHESLRKASVNHQGEWVWSIKILKMGKGRKRLQNTNKKVQLLQQDLDDALQEIDRLQKKSFHN